MNISSTGRLLSLLLIPIFSATTFSQMAGTLDAQFGAAGSTQVSFLTFQAECKAMAIQADGKSILGGQYLSGGLGNMAITRFNTNGTLDNTFGSSGKAIIPFNNSNVILAAVQVLSTGKIIIGGNSDGNPVIVRLNANGAVDNTFGASGQVSFDGDLVSLIDLVVVPGGKMVGCGIADQGSGKLFCAFRRNADGSADNTFGTNGFAYANIGAQPAVSRLAVQPDNKVLLTGTIYVAPRYDLALFRFNANGTPDSGFGANGLVASKLSTNNAYGLGNSIAVQQDGKIVVAGRIANAGPTVFVIARYNSNGVIDATFGTNGATTINFFNSVDEAKAVAVQSDGKIIVGGTALNGSNRVNAIARLTKTGAMDTGFGAGGKTTTAIGTKVFGDAMVLQADSKILLAGSATISNISQFSVARYHAGTVLSAASPDAGLDGLNVFPNPVQAGTQLQLRFNLKEGLNCQFQLLALDGRLITSYPRQLLSVGVQVLDLKIPETAPAGQLLLRAETEQGTQVVQVLVQH